MGNSGEKYINIISLSKSTQVARLISDRTDFRTKIVFRYKERHYIMIKGLIL